MENNQFATFKPILEDINVTPQSVNQYYSANGITPDNEYITKYMNQGTPPVSFNQTSQGFSVPDFLSEYYPGSSTSSVSTSSPTIASTITPTPMNFTGSGKELGKQAMNFFVGKGYTKAQASGIIGNLFSESGLNTKASGDKGLATGIAQWHPDRQAKFKQIIGKDIKNSSLGEQLSFVDWELHNTENKALQGLLQSKTPTEAAKAFGYGYERMKTFKKDRSNNAENFFKQS